MRKINFILILTLAPLLNFAKNSGEKNESLNKEALVLNCENKPEEPEEIKRDCTIKIKSTIQGVKVDLEITLSDVSWGDCLLFKTGLKAAEALL